MTETRTAPHWVALVNRWWLVALAVAIGLLTPGSAILFGLVAAFFVRGDRAVALSLVTVSAVFAVVFTAAMLAV